MATSKRKVKGVRRQLPPEDEQRRADLAEQIEREEKAAIDRRAADVFARAQRLRDLVALLKAERERQGVSLNALSARTGINKSNLSRLENDARVNPTMETLQRLAEALGKQIRVELVDAV